MWNLPNGDKNDMSGHLGSLMTLREIGSPNRLPPYISYITWQKILIGSALQKPTRLDAVFFENSGISSFQMLAAKAALRFFKFIDDKGNVAANFKELFSSDKANQKEILTNLFKLFYAPLFEEEWSSRLNSKKLQGYFRKLGAKGDISRKCTTFFINAAIDLDLTIAPRFQKLSRHVNSSTSPDDIEKLKLVEIVMSKFPMFDSEWPTEIKKQWFSQYDQLIQLINK
jgi:hypothetical protein